VPTVAFSIFNKSGLLFIGVRGSIMKSNDIARISRRTFLGLVLAAISVPLVWGSLNTAVSGPGLAINGGLPVRTTPLTTNFPGAQFYGNHEGTAVTEAVESQRFFRWYGPKTHDKVASFEKEFAKFLGVKYVLGLTSGAASLHAALTATGVGPGDEVILPA
jgi:hypothetical protein